jgi:O-antigen ligase
MTTLAPHVPGAAGGLLRGLAASWRGPADVRDDSYVAGERPHLRLAALAGVILLGLAAGAAVGFAGTKALLLAVSLLACVFILLDFRIGVVLLVLLVPISRSAIFPHALFGITGANPLNLLLGATLGSYLLHALFGGRRRGFFPAPLAWLYVAPILVAGALGVRHVGQIAPAFYLSDQIAFGNAAGYLVESVVKPLTIVIFALLLGAAVARSAKPERFLAPTLLSMWLMSLLTIGFVATSGISLGQLASSESREFFAPLGMHANELGRLYAIAYALLLFTWAESKDKGLKLMLAASMAITAVALMLTFSRGAFLGFLVVHLVFVVLRLNVRTVFFIGLLALGLVLLPVAVYERVSTGFGSGLNAIAAGRIDGLWLPLLPEVLKNPLFGSGHYSILWSDAMRLGGGGNVLLVTHPHNAYLQALLDMGVVGLALLCAYFVHVWKRARALSAAPDLSPTLRGFYLGAAAAVVALLVMGIADGGLTPRSEHAFLWLAIGMMYGQYAKRPVE